MITNCSYDRLRRRWQQLFTSFSLEKSRVEELYHDWYVQMANRAYHNCFHIDDLLEHFDRCKNDVCDTLAVSWAIWFHDFETTSIWRDPVEQSAARAAAILAEAMAPASFINKVRHYILATKSHQVTATDSDLQYLLDFDLAILGETPRNYNIYLAAIRREFRWLPRIVFRARRKAILRSFLRRPTLFHTVRFRKLYEGRARANLQAEIKSLKWIAGGAALIPEVTRKQAFNNCLQAFTNIRARLIRSHHDEKAVFENGHLLKVGEKSHYSGAKELIDQDLVFSFVIRSRQEEAKELQDSTRSIWSLLSEPFLDTDMPVWEHQAEAILRVRGLSPSRIKLLHTVVGTGLWWNVLWWEWIDLGKEDVIYGWRQNYLLTPGIGIIAAGIGGGLVGLLSTGAFVLSNFLWVEFWCEYLDQLEKKKRETR